MDDVDLDQVTRPKENVTDELSYVPVQHLDSQDYEEKGIRQIRPIQGPLDRGRPVQDGEGSPRTNLGSYPAHLRNLISSPHRCSLPMLTTDSWRTITAISSRVEVLVHFREMKRPLTQTEDRKIQEGQPKEVVARERFCRMWPDGIVVHPPVGNKTGVFFILEHKRMSDVCDQYITGSKHTEEDQYVSLHSVISTVIQSNSGK